jgi:hypothetical protein
MEERTGGRMTEPIRRIAPESRSEGVTPWQSLKAVGFMLILLGPGLPITVLLWRLAVGPW